MADLRRIKLMRGNESTRDAVVPEQGEQISTIDELKVYLGDGIKAGGYVVNADNTIAVCENQAISSSKHSLAWWINWFNGSNATIRIPKGIHNILTSMTVPSNICLKFDKGAYFNIPSGVILTVNGDIDAGIWEVYTGSGTVNGTAYHPTRPEMPTPEYTDDSNRIATTAFVKDVLSTDPILDGTPTAPTVEYTDNSDKIATTAFVKNVLSNDPALDGIPTAPTAPLGTNTTQIATTAFVDAKVADAINDGVTGIAPSQNAVFDALTLKADLDSPALTGIPEAPTASVGTNTTQLATTEFVKSEIDSVLAVADVLTFKGTIGVGGTVTSLPSSDYKIGWTYKVITAGTYSGYACEIGDMITCVVDFNITPNNSDWTVIQSNLDGAVIGPASAINNHISVFNGITGKLIKDSGFTIETSVPSGALFTDTVYTHPTSGVSAGTYKSVTVNENGHVTTGTNPTTLSEYGITDAANLNSPALTGIPTAPTAPLGTNTTQIATTEFVNDNIANFFNSSSKTFISTDLQVDFNIADIYVDNYFSFSVYRNGVLQSLGIDYTLDTTTDNEKITMTENCDADEIIIVMFNSNTTHVPTAPTATINTNNNQIATTAYADAKVADEINNDVTTIAPSQNAVFDALILKADITDLEYLMMEGDPT